MTSRVFNLGRCLVGTLVLPTALLAACVVAPTAPGAVTRGPYLQRATPTSAVVRWRTENATNSRVHYGLAPDTLTATADSAPVTTEHSVTINDLQPSTKYYYAIGSTSEVMAGADEEHFFVTSPSGGVPTRIWIIGDSGTANSNAEAVRDAYLDHAGTQRTNLWLMLGDNAYNDGTDSEYQEAVFEMYPMLLRNTILWSTLGNHDGHTADSASESGPYYDIFTFPRNAEAGGLASGTEAYYSFDYGNIHFVCLDSYETSRAPGDAMLTWLADDLADTVSDWIIAFWHHPPYTKGSHDSDTEGQLIDMRRNALPILEAAGVDLVFTGHSHSYERSFLLDGHYGSSSTLTDLMVRDNGDGRVDGDGAYVKTYAAEHDGAVYVVAGSSGKISGGDLDHPAMFISLNQLGSVVLDVDGLALDAKFLRSNGSITDHFRIVKNVPEPPGPPADPVPGHEAIDVSPESVLSWSPGSFAGTYEVYLGTAPELGPADLQAIVDDASFDPGRLVPFTTYHWRVDSVNDLGRAPGPTWRFTTGATAVALEYGGVATATTGASGSFDVPVPAGASEGELLIAVIAKEQVGEITPPGGWNIISESADAGKRIRLGVFSRTASSGEPDAYTFTATEDKKAVGAILRYCCAADAGRIDVWAVNDGQSDTPTAPGVTTTVDGAMLIRVFGAKDDDLAADPYPAGHDGRFALQSGGRVCAGVADVLQPSPGPSGAAEFALTANKDWRAVTLAIAPAVATDDECPADINGDGRIAFTDLLSVLGLWGQTGALADINDDGIVDFSDLLTVLALWGPCRA